MKRSLLSLAILVVLSCSLPVASLAQVTIPDHTGLRNPNRGSDGILTVTANRVIDLSLASTGDWDAPGATLGNGVYDPAKWAVVFKYSKVNIAGGTLSFINHPSGAPVVWLVDGDAVGDGDVTITGNLSLNGSPETLGWQGSNTGYASGGPGGFASGFNRFTTGQLGSAGFGPGGGHWAANGNTIVGAGSHATTGAGSSGPTYWAHPDALRCLPLIGGSGGTAFNNGAGGAGGGAILIATRGTVTLNGSVSANGGGGVSSGYGGAGGAIRLIADQVLGSGALFANPTNQGGQGRRRIEVRTNLNLPSWVPDAVSTQGGVTGGIATLWPLPANDFKVKIVSIAGRDVPAEPLHRHTFPNTDLSLGVAGPSYVVIETQNVTSDKIVRLRVRRKSGAEAGTNGYIQIPYLSHDSTRNVDIWAGNAQLPTDVSFVQAEVVLP